MARLSLAFAVSGFAALLCQIVWQRMLGVFAGSDTVSAALVVGAFLSGLGIGSIIGAKLADRLSPRHALLGFIACEAGVALFALVSKPLLYDLLAIGLAEHVQAPAAVFALCFAGLLLPTTLMGASLPLLSRAVAVSLDTVAERIARLYGLNTLGAGLGALAGGWLIVGELGYVGALATAASLDIAAAAIALTLLPAMACGTPTPRPARAEAREPWGGLGTWCALVFLSGYVIVALEIIWVRVLGQVGQYHAYLFPTILGVFLLADGLGMAFAARLLRRSRDPRPAFFATQTAGFVVGAALLLGLWWAMGEAPLRDAMSVDELRFGPEQLAISVLLIVAVVAPPSFLIGMTFPFVQRAVQRDLATVGARVGWVQLANILGNAAGSLGTGLVTFHLLGTTGTLTLLAAASLGLVAAWALARAGRARWPAVAAAATAGVALAIPPADAFWQRLHVQRDGAFHVWHEDRSGIAFYRGEAEGAGRDPGRFFIMGHGQGYVPFLDIHMLLGMLGPLIHPNPERVLAIGVGSAGTPWGALVNPATRELRAIELVRPVLESLEDIAQARPDSAVAALLRDKRVRLEHGDGRRALTRLEERFDVIEADAILPQSSHSGLLYSREYLDEVRERLAPGGIYVQWAPTWRVVDTFASAFPYVVLLKPVSILIGSDRPIPLDQGRLLATLRGEAAIAHARAGNPRVGDLGALLTGEPEFWRPGMPRVDAPLTDMFPRDEFFLNHGVVLTGHARPR